MESGAGFGVVAVAVLLVVTPVAGVTTVGVAGAQTDADIVVDDDGGADYEEIGNAIENASAGDTIRIREGTYNPEPISISKRLRLVGDPGDDTAGPGPNAPVIEGIRNFKTSNPAIVIEGIIFRKQVTMRNGGTLRDVLMKDKLLFNEMERSGRVRLIRTETRFVAIEGTVLQGAVVNESRIGGIGSSIGRIENVRIVDSEGTGEAIRRELGFGVDRFRVDDKPIEPGIENFSFVRSTKSEGGVELLLSGPAVEDVTVRSSSVPTRISGTYFNDSVITNNSHDARLAVDSRSVHNVSVTDNTARAIRFQVSDRFIYNGDTSSELAIRNNSAQSLEFYGRAESINSLEILDNTVSGGNGNLFVELDNASIGTVDISDNTVSSGAFKAFQLRFREADVDNLELQNNTARNSEVGFRLNAGGIDANRLNVTNNTVDNDEILQDSVGYEFTLNSDVNFNDEFTTTDEFRFVDNEVRNAEIGARFDIDNATTGEFDLSRNSIERTEFAGISIGSTSPSPKSRPLTVKVRSNTIKRGESSFSSGIFVNMRENSASDLIIKRNRIDRLVNGMDVRIGRFPTRIRKNLISKTETGVFIVTRDRTARLRRNNFLDTSEFAVDKLGSGALDARNNYWDAADGPDSPTRTLADPVTGALANGSGGNVSESPSTDGVTNVRFDPFLGDPVSITIPETPEGPETPETPSVSSEERPGGIPRPEFEYVGEATPDAIDRNGTVTVNVTVRNDGEAPGRFDGRLTNGFETLAEQGGQLAPGESTNLSYRVRFDEVSVEQLFVDREFIDEVQVNLPTPEELSRRHLRVDAAYATREVVAPGEPFELVAVLNNTDGEAHEFAIEAEAFRTTEPTESSTRVLDRRGTLVLRGGERRVVRYEVTAPPVDGPRGLAGFVARSSAGNVSVVPASTRPTGVTAAYAARNSETVGVDEHVAVVVQNGNETTETVAVTLEPPGVERDTEAALMEGRMEFVTVAPGEAERVEIPVDRLSADESPRTWAVNGRTVPVVGADVRETPSPGAVLDEAVEGRETNTTDAAT